MLIGPSSVGADVDAQTATVVLCSWVQTRLGAQTSAVSEHYHMWLNLEANAARY